MTRTGATTSRWSRPRCTTGCMVHVVTSVLDEGAVFATAEVPVSAADSRDDIEERMHAAEHVLLVDVLRGLADRGEES